MALLPHLLSHRRVERYYYSGINSAFDQLFRQRSHDISQSADFDKGQRFTGRKKNFHIVPPCGGSDMLAFGDDKRISLVAGKNVVFGDIHVFVGNDAI